MAAPPAMIGISGRLIPRSSRAWRSSQSAMATTAPTYARNVAFTVNRVISTRPPSAVPMAAATGRLRPVRLGLRSLTGPASPWASSSCRKLYLEELGFLVFKQLVYLCDIGVREIVELPFRPAPLVLARIAALDQLVERVLGVPADVANGDPAVLRLVPRDLDVLAPALLGELREDDPDDRAVIGRVDAKVAVPDRLLDRCQRCLVEWLDNHHPRLRHMERSQLVHGCLGPVVLGRDLVEHRRMRPAGADAGELLLGDRDGLLHLLLGLEEGIVNHCGSCALVGVPVRVLSEHRVVPMV